MNFIEIILKEMKNKKISAYKLCKDIGISQQTFSNWKTGNIPSIDKAIAIIIYLGLSADEIFGINKEEITLTEIEKKIIEQYRKASPGNQESIKKLLDIKDMGKSSESKTG